MYDLYWLQAHILLSYNNDHVDFQNSFPMAKYFNWLQLFTNNKYEENIYFKCVCLWQTSKYLALKSR